MADPADTSTSQTDKKTPTHTSFDEIGFNKSASVLIRRIEEGHSNQAFTLFVSLRPKIQWTKRNHSAQNYSTFQHGSSSPRAMESYSYGAETQSLTNMILVLNKVAADNITNLFPDWHPKPPISNVQEKHFKVLTEIMTEMFLQCGLLIEADIIEMDDYQDFLKALHHHTIMGNISTTQLTHFIKLMVYMSFYRLGHYTEHMVDKNAALLKSAVWISLVIMSFRTTFSMRGSHNTINPYFKNLLTVVRRSVHVVVTRYMEQECSCQNHIQCDIYPTTLTSEVVLPSYRHFLQHIQQTGWIRQVSCESGWTRKVSNESNALG